MNDPRRQLPVLRYVRIAILLGVLVLGAVVYMTQDGRPRAWTELIDELRFLIVALGCAALGAAVMMRRHIARSSDPARATALAIVAWAAVETPAIAGAVVFFITEDVGAYLAGLLIVLLAGFIIPSEIAGENALRTRESDPVTNHHDA